ALPVWPGMPRIIKLRGKSGQERRPRRRRRPPRSATAEGFRAMKAGHTGRRSSRDDTGTFPAGCFKPPLDNCRLLAYTSKIASDGPHPASTPCLCNALRQATRAVSRLYDEDLRGAGLRTTQYSLLRHLRAAGEARQRDLGGLTSLDETTLTRNLRPLI